MANPKWSRDELILALEFYRSNLKLAYRQQSPEIARLAKEISAVAKALGLSDSTALRNENSVYMKLMNFRSRDPDVLAKGQRGLERGNQLEVEIWEHYENRQVKLKRDAAAIRSLCGDEATKTMRIDSQDDPSICEAQEGQLLTREHVRRERSSALVGRKKTAQLQKYGRLFCEVCEFDFAKVYGQRGEGYIECHHKTPVSQLTPDHKTTLGDLSLLCSNCHRIVHSELPWLTMEALKSLVTR